MNVTAVHDASEPTEVEAARMTIGEHLEELRRRIILALVGLAVGMCIGLWIGRDLVELVCQPLANVQRSAKLPVGVTTLSVIGGFMVYLKVALVFGIVLASPWIMYQLWQFIAAGLYASERRIVYLIAPFSAFLSTLGLMFAYYIMLPVCLAFLVFFSASYDPAAAGGPSALDMLTNLIGHYAKNDAPAAPADATGAPAGSADNGTTPAATELTLPRVARLAVDPPHPADGAIWVNPANGELRIYLDGVVRNVPLQTSSLVHPQYEVGEYVDFALWIMLAVVVAFQLPLAMLMLAWSGLVPPQTVARFRRHCILACFIVGGVLTPADPFSIFVLALPLCALFELGLILMRFSYKQRNMEEGLLG